jgi:hypothetical protein
MTLREFEKYMEDDFFAHWTSFYIAPRDKSERIRLNADQYDIEINQIDYIGLSVGNESFMLNLTVYAGEEINEPIEITSKMLGSNFNKCFYIMREICARVKTCYYSVNSNM